MKIFEITRSQNNIIYKKPKLAFEYQEILRYPQYKNITSEEWNNLADTGFEVVVSEFMLNFINNTDGTSYSNAKAAFSTLDSNKQTRFNQALRSGIIEMPILLKYNSKHYELVSGNTRFTGLLSHNILPHVWMINVK